MIYTIVAIDNKRGISKNGKIPWYIPDDMKYFKEITKNSILVVGKNTFNQMNISKVIKDREIYVISSKYTYSCEIDITGKITYFNNDEDLYGAIISNKKNVFICGGSRLYSRYLTISDKIFITEINKDFKCDNFFPNISNLYNISYYSELRKYIDIEYRFLEYSYDIKNSKNGEECYINLIKDIITNGDERPDRTGIGTISLFSPKELRFDISTSIPLFTSKRVPWKMAIEELLWMLRGESDSKILEERGIGIWKGNTSRDFLDKKGLIGFEEGETGELYGHNLRNFGVSKFENVTGMYKAIENPDNGFDQLMYVENLLKTDPFSRRIMWNLWNTHCLDKAVLTTCFTKGSLVLTKKGYKDISSILLGESVLTHTGEWKEVLNTMKFNYSGKLYKIKTKYNDDILTVTGEHPFLVRDHANGKLSKPFWVEAKDLDKTKHFLTVPINNNEIMGDFIDIELMFIIGYIIRNIEDGYFNLDEMLYERFSKICDIHYVSKGRYIIKDSTINTILANKNMEWIQDLPKEYIREFIMGFVYSKNGIYSVKRCMAYSLQRMFSKLGVFTSISKDSLGYNVISIFNIEEYFLVLDKNYMNLIIEDITMSETEDKTVYNLEVESDHSYTINNIITSNCHNQFQLYVTEENGIKYLSGKVYIRSSDTILGLPFNVFAYGVLINILALRCDMKPKELIVSFGDAHIYKNHIEKTKEILLNREPYSLPRIELNEAIKTKDYSEITIDDFKIIGYYPNGMVKFDMAV